MITINQLKKILPNTRLSTLSEFIDPLNRAMDEFQINTKIRQSAFIAQVSHESVGFSKVRECLIYSSATRICAVWPKRFPVVSSAVPYVKNEEKLANLVYSNRMGNGSPESGDGFKYRGRGLIQITGRDNYSLASDSLHVDLISHPELLELPEYAARSAGWFWETNGLNELADKDDFTKITKRINGGTNGLAERKAYYEIAKKVLGV